MRWIMVQDLLATANPSFDIMIRPRGKFKIFFFKLIHSKIFEIVIMVCIILNILSMAMVFESMSDSYSSMLNSINLIFTLIFILEFVLKIIALDFQYFKVSWNIFDFTIVMLSKLSN